MIRAKKFELQEKLVWESIEASLPTQVGTLDIRDFCASEALHDINHFEDFCGRKMTKQLANPQGSLLMMMNGLMPTVAKGHFLIVVLVFLLESHICIMWVRWL